MSPFSFSSTPGFSTTMLVGHLNKGIDWLVFSVEQGLSKIRLPLATGKLVENVWKISDEWNG